MSELSRQNQLWNQVLAIAESMEDPAIPLAQIQQMLCGLEEGFANAFDPAEEFAEFVTQRLCRSVMRMVERVEGRDDQGGV